MLDILTHSALGLRGLITKGNRSESQTALRVKSCCIKKELDRHSKSGRASWSFVIVAFITDSTDSMFTKAALLYLFVLFACFNHYTYGFKFDSPSIK